MQCFHFGFLALADNFFSNVYGAGSVLLFPGICLEMVQQKNYIPIFKNSLPLNWHSLDMSLLTTTEYFSILNLNKIKLMDLNLAFSTPESRPS